MSADPTRVDIVSIGEPMIEFNQLRPGAPERSRWRARLAPAIASPARCWRGSRPATNWRPR
ncbi:MAG TPA: hypothetical protein VNU48_02210 [Burkholderiaceae bacterium]|nr:hypothetical protein [Burkholderiaceae bacterium]